MGCFLGGGTKPPLLRGSLASSPALRPRRRLQRVWGGGDEAGRTRGGRRGGVGRRPCGAGYAGRAGRASGPLRAAPEEVPGPGGSGLSFLVLLGRDCPCGCGRALRPEPAQVPPADPMALVTVSRSPPASGYSTPVGPSVSLALLWCCPRSWLPAGPRGARPAYGQPPFKAGGGGRTTLGPSGGGGRRTLGPSGGGGS